MYVSSEHAVHACMSDLAVSAFRWTIQQSVNRPEWVFCRYTRLVSWSFLLFTSANKVHFCLSFLVYLSDGLLKKLWMNFCEIFGSGRPLDKKQFEFVCFNVGNVHVCSGITRRGNPTVTRHALQ